MHDSIHVDVLLRHTPVKDQGKSEACWIYAYLACLETERIEQFGDSLNLSATWLLRSNLQEQAIQRYLCHGKRKISSRGIGPDAEYLLYKYGMVPYSNFNASEGFNSKVIERSLLNRVDVAIRAKKGVSGLIMDIEHDLPTPTHNLEHGFYLYSMYYTPQQFGKSILAGVDFEWYSSYEHHPFGELFDLEVPDNRRHMMVHNIPLDRFLSLTISSLKNHHPVFWEGKMPPMINSLEKTTEVTRNQNDILSMVKSRQKAFETFQVYDQHAMAIIGLAHDKAGKHYFICKNSWGKQWEKQGFCYMSIEEFLINTILIGIINQ